MYEYHPFTAQAFGTYRPVEKVQLSLPTVTGFRHPPASLQYPQPKVTHVPERLYQEPSKSYTEQQFYRDQEYPEARAAQVINTPVQEAEPPCTERESFKHWLEVYHEDKRREKELLQAEEAAKVRAVFAEREALYPVPLAEVIAVDPLVRNLIDVLLVDRESVKYRGLHYSRDSSGRGTRNQLSRNYHAKLDSVEELTSVVNRTLRFTEKEMDKWPEGVISGLSTFLHTYIVDLAENERLFGNKKTLMLHVTRRNSYDLEITTGNTSTSVSMMTLVVSPAVDA